MDAVFAWVGEQLRGWGAGRNRTGHALRAGLCDALILAGSPCLDDVTVEILERARSATPHHAAAIVALSRVLAARSIIPRPVESAWRGRVATSPADAGVPRDLGRVDRPHLSGRRGPGRADRRDHR